MVEPTFQKLACQQPPDFEKRPLYRFQEYLRQLKVSIILLRECLVEVKELIVLVGLIFFFVWGMIELFLRLYR